MLGLGLRATMWNTASAGGLSIASRATTTGNTSLFSSGAVLKCGGRLCKRTARWLIYTASLSSQPAASSWCNKYTNCDDVRASEFYLAFHWAQQVLGVSLVYRYCLKQHCLRLARTNTTKLGPADEYEAYKMIQSWAAPARYRSQSWATTARTNLGGRGDNLHALYIY